VGALIAMATIGQSTGHLLFCEQRLGPSFSSPRQRGFRLRSWRHAADLSAAEWLDSLLAVRTVTGQQRSPKTSTQLGRPL